MFMKKLMALAVASSFFVMMPLYGQTVSSAYAASKATTKNASDVKASAIVLVETLGKEAVKLLSDKNISEADKREGFGELISRDFDMPLIGRFVLGKSWRTATEEEKREYLKLFQQYIISTYQKRIGDYAGENLKTIKAVELNSKEVLVKSEIIRPKGPPIKLDWRVRESKNDGQKIIDIIVENVSMALTHRDEFSSVISRNNGKVEALLQTLRDHMASLPN